MTGLASTTPICPSVGSPSVKPILRQPSAVCASSALAVTTMELRKVLTPPPLEMLLVLTVARVSGAARITLQPVSRSCVAPAKVMPVYSQTLRSPRRMEVG